MVDTSPTFPDSISVATLRDWHYYLCFVVQGKKKTPSLNHMTSEEWAPETPRNHDLLMGCSSPVVAEEQRMEEIWKLFSRSVNFAPQSRSVWLGNIPMTRNSIALAHAWRRAIYTSILKFSNSKQLATRTVLYALLNADTKTAFAKRGNPVKLGCKFGPNLA